MLQQFLQFREDHVEVLKSLSTSSCPLKHLQALVQSFATQGSLGVKLWCVSSYPRLEMSQASPATFKYSTIYKFYKMYCRELVLLGIPFLLSERAFACHVSSEFRCVQSAWVTLLRIGMICTWSGNPTHPQRSWRIISQKRSNSRKIVHHGICTLDRHVLEEALHHMWRKHFLSGLVNCFSSQGTLCFTAPVGMLPLLWHNDGAIFLLSLFWVTYFFAQKMRRCLRFVCLQLLGGWSRRRLSLKFHNSDSTGPKVPYQTPLLGFWVILDSWPYFKLECFKSGLLDFFLALRLIIFMALPAATLTGSTGELCRCVFHRCHASLLDCNGCGRISVILKSHSSVGRKKRWPQNLGRNDFCLQNSTPRDAQSWRILYHMISVSLWWELFGIPFLEGIWPRCRVLLRYNLGSKSEVEFHYFPCWFFEWSIFWERPRCCKSK